METIFDQVWKKKYLFLGVFFVVFTISYIILVAIDVLPEAPAATASPEGEVQMHDTQEGVNTASEADTEMETVVNTENNKETVATNDVSSLVAVAANELPVKIVIEKLDRVVSVANPTSRTIADLDAALLEGTVRHPDSATLSQEGNVFILGHSSYLPQVFNKNFQAFNGIQNLAWGDTIKVYSEDSLYEYRVEKVYRARAQDLTVPIAGTGKILTLATCNSFGSTDDRYIVEAKQIRKEAL